jgi:beta-N-acetylhexosaminidase
MPSSRPKTTARLKTLAKLLVVLVVLLGVALIVAVIANRNRPKPPVKPPQKPGLSVPSDFTLSDKIGQMLVVGVTDKNAAIELEKKYQIGGFLLMTGANLFSKEATDTVKQVGKLPPLFTIDQEGGEVSRLPNSEFRQFTATHLGGLPDAQVQHIAQTMGQAMADIGAHVDYAPVVDLDNGHNATISMFRRSFSSDPAIVARKAGAFANGLRAAGVAPTFKHFPGLGSATGVTNGNTDTGPATTPPLSQLKQRDLKPYETLSRQGGVSAVMVGNQIVPGLTHGMPASLSGDAYNLLRTMYGFKQVVFTDELIKAKAVADAQPNPALAVIAAIKAGADMPLIVPDNSQQVGVIIKAVADAAQSGQLHESQIDTALQRIMSFKTAIKH